MGQLLFSYISRFRQLGQMDYIFLKPLRGCNICIFGKLKKVLYNPLEKTVGI